MNSMPTKPPDDIRYSKGALCGRTCWNLRSTWIFVLAPLILLALPLSIHTQEARCAYVILLMMCFFLTEVLPIPIVSIMPLVLMPFLEIVPPKDLSKVYMKENVVAFLGSIMVATSLQRWNIPRRLALWTLLKVGADIRRLLFCIMVTTAFVSMWMNNSPTAIMMIPIAKSVATAYSKQFSMEVTDDRQEPQANGEVIVNMQLQEDKPETIEESPVEEQFIDDEEFEEMSQEQKSVLKLFILSIPWSCNIGGAASLYGTGNNLLLNANLESEFEDPTVITVVSWFAFSLPCSLIMLTFGWAWLIVFHLGWRSLFVCRRKSAQLLQREANFKSIFLKKYRKLGPMSFAEYAAVGHMTVLVLAWITMDPGFVPGWSSLLSKRFSSPYPPAILLAISTFIFPSVFPNFLRFWDKNKMSTPHTPAPALMDWKTMNKLLPWNILLLIGGGMAIAEGIKTSEQVVQKDHTPTIIPIIYLANIKYKYSQSGLSVWIAGNLDMLKDYPPFAIVTLSVAFVTVATEFMSGGALLAIVHPILANLAVRLHIHPLYLMFPASIGAVYSFMMPTASATNAISYSAGVLTIPDMLKPGIVMNVLGIFVISLAANTWGTALFQLDTFPQWAGGNSTTYNVTT